MKLNVFMTLILGTVLLLASANQAQAGNTAGSSTTTASAPPTQDFHLKLNLSRSTNLVDFHDGTRTDGMDYEIDPSLKTPWGTVMASITYSQDLRDQTSESPSDWGDVPVILILAPTKLHLFGGQAKVAYQVSATIPASKKSVKKDELQASVGGKISLSVESEDSEGFSYGGSISAGQNFHAYEEDINGAVLNKFSSNQSITAGYSLADWSVSLLGINRTRWTYRNNIKSSFEISEELAYSANKNIELAMGHTNAGSPLKANGTDSNIELVNENTSTVYGALTLTY